MGLHRRAAHRDKAEPGIIAALRAVGATVVQLSAKGVPDLLVGYRGRTVLLEVKSIISTEHKDGYTRTRKTRVDVGQVEFAERWRGGLLAIVHTPEEALAAVGAGSPVSALPTTRRAVKHPAR